MPDQQSGMLDPELVALLDNTLQASQSSIYVAIDGHSGSGKSTLAAAIAKHYGQSNTSIIAGDDFYSGGSVELWDHRSAEQNALLAVNWQRLKTAVTALKSNASTQWLAFDWHSTNWQSNTPPHQTTPESAVQRDINIIEGVYSARAELAALYDCKILLIVPEQIRQQRLKARDGADYCQRWHDRWNTAETVYFQLNCVDNFDIVIEQAC